MKKNLRTHVAALCLLLPATASFVSLPAVAAKRVAPAPAPEIHEMQVAADGPLSAGTELSFTLEGSTRGVARVRIPGTNVNMALRETEPGVYTGTYTIRRADRIQTNKPVRASLSSGKRTVFANYNLPASLTAPVAAAPAPQILRIERFTADSMARLTPGTELRFRLQGLPGATASFTIPGVATNVPMREVSPGQYVGTYTLRSQDNVNPASPIVATLRAGDKVVTANLAEPPVGADNRPPVIGNMVPRDGEIVHPAATQLVSGSFFDRGGVGVDPASVRILVSGRDVTSQSNVTAQSFSYRGPLTPGRHTVEVTARDRAGNATRRTWSFEVEGAAAAAPVNVPIQILSHANNAQVDGGVITVRGRAAPLASVNVKVNAVPPIIGQFGVAQQVFSQTIQADANGNFEFSFTSPFPVPGTRYDVAMTATRANVTNEARLILFQRQG